MKFLNIFNNIHYNYKVIWNKHNLSNYSPYHTITEIGTHYTPISYTRGKLFPGLWNVGRTPTGVRAVGGLARDTAWPGHCSQTLLPLTGHCQSDVVQCSQLELIMRAESAHNEAASTARPLSVTWPTTLTTYDLVRITLTWNLLVSATVTSKFVTTSSKACN